MLNTKKIKKKDIKYNIWLTKCIDLSNKEYIKMTEQVINIRDRIEK